MASSNRSGRNNNNSMIFSAWNYKILALGILMVVVGFSAMYMENEVKGFISLYVSPIMIMTGYVAVIIAILKHDDGTENASEQA